MFFRRLNWNIVGWFRIVSAISYVVIAAGLITMGVHWHNTGAPLRLGLSFTGGTDVTLKFDQTVTQAQIASALSGVGVGDERVNTLTKAGDVPDSRWSIETQTDFGNDSTKLWTALGTVARSIARQSSISTVGPTLSHEYLLHALYALFIAITIQFIYIAFRFGWNYIFGLVAIIALVRDSLDDDRDLCHRRQARRRRVPGRRADRHRLLGHGYYCYSRPDSREYEAHGRPAVRTIVNTSILQTMTRSVNTLATVVITLVALLALGGAR